MELTPWYLRMIGFKKYRRRVIVSVLIIFDASKWWYYNEEQKLKWEAEQAAKKAASLKHPSIAQMINELTNRGY